MTEPKQLVDYYHSLNPLFFLKTFCTATSTFLPTPVNLKHSEYQYPYQNAINYRPDVQILNGGVVLEPLQDVDAALERELVAAEVETLDEPVELEEVPHRAAALQPQPVGGEVHIRDQLVQGDRLGGSSSLNSGNFCLHSR